MAITVAKEFLSEIKKRMTLGNLTSDLVGQFKFNGVNEVLLAKSTRQSMASYNKATGYVEKEYSLGWQSMPLSQRRSAKFKLDEVDNAEALNVAVEKCLMDLAVESTEEIDTYKLATIAANANIQKVATGATLASGADVQKAISDGEKAITNGKGIVRNCVLYVSASCYYALKDVVAYRFGKGDNPDTLFETYDGMKCVVVPDDMLFVGSQFNSTTGAIEPKVTAGKKTMANFLIVNPDAIAAPVTISRIKLINAEDNQDSDDHLIIPTYRYDTFVIEEYAKSVYCHFKAEVTA